MIRRVGFLTTVLIATVLLTIRPSETNLSELEVAESVQITTRDHKPVRSPLEGAEISKFNEIWRVKTPLAWKENQIPGREFQYFIDINSPKSGGRYRYHISGIATKLAHNSQTRYQIRDVSTLNKLLSIER
jgi:hypothetical protein